MTEADTAIDHQHAIERQALERKYARAKQISPLLDKLPKRTRKAGELGPLIDLIQASHELLGVYDLADEQPALAGSAETTFDAAIEQLRVVIAKREAAAAAGK